MSKQAELDAILDKLARDYGKLNDRQVEYAIKEVGRVRGDIAELLSEFAAEDGTVQRRRLSRLLRELDEIEKRLRVYGQVTLDSVIKESAEFAVAGITGGLSTVTGVAIAASIERINRNTVDYVIKRFGDDGLVLSDRIWTTSGDIRDAIASSLRADIIRGESVSTMVRNIREVYDTETWKIKRLAVTEGNTAYRVGSANSVKQSKVSDWVRLNDNPGRHRNHERHACYKLAREDRYGEGRGIFKPTDSEIYLPHPNCTSYITAVLNERYL